MVHSFVVGKKRKTPPTDDRKLPTTVVKGGDGKKRDRGKRRRRALRWGREKGKSQNMTSQLTVRQWEKIDSSPGIWVRCIEMVKEGKTRGDRMTQVPDGGRGTTRDGTLLEAGETNGNRSQGISRLSGKL